MPIARTARRLAPLLALLALPPAVAAGGAASDPAVAMAAWQKPAEVALSPDGRAVAYSVWRAAFEEDASEYRSAIEIAAADGTGTRRLTPPELGAWRPRWSPDGGAIAFLAPSDGRDQLWLVAAAGGAPRRLSDAPAPLLDFRWLPDGRGFVVVAASGAPAGRGDAARRVDAAFDAARLWRLDLPAAGAGPAAATPLTPPDLHVVVDVELSFGTMLRGFDVSPDGRSVVFTHMPTPRVSDWKKTDLAVVDVATGAIRPLAATARAEGAPLFSPDGKLVAYSASDDPPTFSFAARVQVVPAGGGAPRALALTPDERPAPLGWSADGGAIYVVETRGTRYRVSALPLDGAPPRDVDAGDRVATSIALDASRSRIAFVGERVDEPPQVFTTPVAPWAPHAATDFPPPVPRAAIGRTELLRWPGPRGLEVEGLLTYPLGYEPGKRYPLLLVVHGGPTWFFLEDYLATPDVYPLAAFAARGFALLRVNPRGSSGRGRDFRFANVGDWGGGDYEDLMAGVDRVIAMGVADPARLGVMGWSYGGYMTDWIVGRTRRFRAASSGAGIANLTSFAGTSDILDFLPDYFGGAPWEKPEAYVAHSPLFHLAGATTPTLLQHGDADRRVPLEQGEQMYRALVRLGIESELDVYPRQPHGLAEPRMILDAARRNLDWFERHLAAP